jgi:chaperonin cofactor prefoldin
MPEETSQVSPPLRPHSVPEDSLPHRKGVGPLWWAVIALLAAALGGLAWYGFPALKKHSALLAQLPAIQQTLSTLSKRLDVADEKLLAWTTDWQSRMVKLNKKIDTDFQLARRMVLEQTALAQQRLHAELDTRTETIQTRLGRLESKQESDAARLARLQHEIAGVRQEMTQQVALLQQDSSRRFGDLEQHVVNVDRHIDRDKRDLDSLARRLDWQRVDFELTKDHSRELAPGISLGITRTDTRYRRFNGWLWLMPDRRTVWVRDQGAQRPVVFYNQRTSRPYQLVVTQVMKHAVAGYLLLPARPGAEGVVADRARNVSPARPQP